MEIYFHLQHELFDEHFPYISQQKIEIKILN